MQTYLVASVAVDKASVSFDKLYDYKIPEKFSEIVKKGVRVIVPFGHGNKKRTAMVMDVRSSENIVKLKSIDTVLDKEPVLNDEALRLVNFLKNRTFCSYYDAVSAILPTGMTMRVRYIYSVAEDAQIPTDKQGREIFEFVKSKKKGADKSAVDKKFPLYDTELLLQQLVANGFLHVQEDLKRKILDETVVMVRLKDVDFNTSKLTNKQRSVVDFLSEVYTASLKEVCYYTGVTKVVLDNLAKNNCVEFFEEEVYRNPYDEIEKGLPCEIELNEEQDDVYNKLLEITKKNVADVALIHGVTGSGKTQVYLKLALDVVESGKNVVVLVPEIALTPQALERFHKVFGKDVAVVHSGLSLGQRLDEYKRIKNGEAKVVIGTRSAILSPVDNIGLIIIDEEQEHTYKSEATPRFFAHDVAKFRCVEHKALLLLCSATPSIESYYFAKSGKYHLYELKNRYSDATLPEVYIVNLKGDYNIREGKTFSEPLLDEIRYNLDNHQQTILLLNRRGHNTSATCTKCAETISCPNCSIPLTYHSANQMLMCHYCSYSQKIPQKCPNCDNNFIRFSGVGTQKAEAELKEYFSNAKILRMDLDTTMSKFSREKYLKDFANQEYDIMIGTQMVAKGLDFPNVTLAAVLSIDSALYSTDFRAYERAFSLITQAVGRSGRSKLKGRAVIQTFTPDNEIIEMAANQDYVSFYEEEIANRRTLLFPPFCDLCVVSFSGENELLTQKAAETFMLKMQVIIQSKFSHLPLNIIGPIPYSVLKVNNKYRYKLILKCKNTKDFRSMIFENICEFRNLPEFKAITVFADINPYSTM